MRNFTATVAGTLLLHGNTVAGQATEQCKCTPTMPCWPAEADWASLNTTLGGQLIKATPPGAVCYPMRPEFNEGLCEELLTAWKTASFHSSSPISIHSSVWAGDSCNPIYPNGTSIARDVNAGEKGCSIGLYPPYVVNATHAEHIQAGLRFAKEHNLRVVVKNTGHAGSGKNLGYGSLSIWTHNLKTIEYDDNWTPRSGNATQMAITVGAGVQDGELFEAAKEANIVAVGGTSMDVGVVGWSTGGGHGLLTGAYGMGADNILEATLVTADGEVLIANEHQNTDLFWAVRGGGAATWGVVVNVTLKAYPTPAVTFLGSEAKAKDGATPHDFWKFMADYQKLMATTDGLSGYWTVNGEPNFSMTIAAFLYNAPNDTRQAATAEFEQLFKDHEATIEATTMNSIHFESWHELLSVLPLSSAQGTQKTVTASRLISEKTVLENVEAFIETMVAIGPKPGQDGNSPVSMSGTMTISRTPVNNSLNPAWRDTVLHVITQRSWDDSFEPEEINELVDDMTYSRVNQLRVLEPTSGAYINEPNFQEPGWQWSFYGPNYGRLREIKRAVDADDLFWCPMCVGSERWTLSDDGTLCRAYEPYNKGS